MLDAATTRPDWFFADHSCDLSECWMEVTDPENELGEACEGFFDVIDNGPGFLPTLTLRGIAVTDSETTFHDRERAIAFLGIREIHRIEDVCAELYEEETR